MITTDVIQGTKIVMRSCMVEDVNEKYVNGMNDHDVNRYLETRFVYQTIDTVSQYVEDVINSDNEYLFAMIELESNTHIGNMHLTIELHHKTCFHAYVIFRKEYWGKGIAKEAIKLITKWSFDNLDIEKMDGEYYEINIGSGKAVLSAGYRKEGCRRKHILLDDGTRCDSIPVGLLKSEFYGMENG